MKKFVEIHISKWRYTETHVILNHSKCTLCNQMLMMRKINIHVNFYKKGKIGKYIYMYLRYMLFYILQRQSVSGSIQRQSQTIIACFNVIQIIINETWSRRWWKKCLLCFKVHYIMMTKPINSTGPTFHAWQDERITDGINDFKKSR